VWQGSTFSTNKVERALKALCLPSMYLAGQVHKIDHCEGGTDENSFLRLTFPKKLCLSPGGAAQWSSHLPSVQGSNPRQCVNLRPNANAVLLFEA
jgi:hypothetical protein